ncbi:lysophospholipid acyltransferase family protein [Ottowia thiooxydans]|uniref:lysophospholipid acyltransferase family protein n=1 Tax=Ottowia thiooxydans TaxID=219182 RepID=UPI0004201922|nr:lipid A biosynthesis acyltransferase [Ottowia thiooxydans]
MQHPGILFMRALALLPLTWIRGLGSAMGHMLFVLARQRRHIALTNLRLAYPQWSQAQRRAVARRSFVYFSQAFLDRSWLWHADPEIVRNRLRIVGATQDLTRDGAVVMFAPHFYGMDAGGSAVMDQIDRPACTIYTTQPDAVLDAWMQRGRKRFGRATLLSRTEGVKPIVRALREGKMLYLLPDMDFGPGDSVFVPFFGVTAATLPSLPRFAKLGHARVVPVVTRLTDTGYEVRVHPAWPDYPGDDVLADTALMNERLQGYINEMPEQYYWVHKRFKTRPPGEASLY